MPTYGMEDHGVMGSLRSEDQEAVNVIMEEHSEELTEWEESFMETISEVLEKGFDLSEKRRAILDKIFRRVVG